jgi:hypothetical protein
MAINAFDYFVSTAFQRKDLNEPKAGRPASHGPETPGNNLNRGS